MNRRVAARYALALMELGEELNILDQVAQDLRDIEETVRGSRELTLVLMSPVINPEQKLKLLTEIFGKRCSEMTMKFITLLIRKDRSEYVLGAAEEFLRMLDVKNQIVHAHVRSAVGLTETERQQLIAKLERMTGKHVRADFNTDPTLRGGFVARVGDDMIDASLKHQLERLREQFAQGGSPVLN